MASVLQMPQAMLRLTGDEARVAEAKRLLPLAVGGDLPSTQIILWEKDKSASSIGRSAYAEAWQQVRSANTAVADAAQKAGGLSDKDNKGRAGQGPIIRPSAPSTPTISPPTVSLPVPTVSPPVSLRPVLPMPAPVIPSLTPHVETVPAPKAIYIGVNTPAPAAGSSGGCRGCRSSKSAAAAPTLPASTSVAAEPAPSAGTTVPVPPAPTDWYAWFLAHKEIIGLVVATVLFLLSRRGRSP